MNHSLKISCRNQPQASFDKRIISENDILVKGKKVNFLPLYSQLLL